MNFSLSSSAQHGGRGFSMFNVNVDLTENGINHTDDIVELLFQVCLGKNVDFDTKI